MPKSAQTLIQEISTCLGASTFSTATSSYPTDRRPIQLNQPSHFAAQPSYKNLTLQQMLTVPTKSTLAVLEMWNVPRNNPMSVHQACLLATRNGGLALRRQDIGVLAVGAKADIVVFNGGLSTAL